MELTDGAPSLGWSGVTGVTSAAMQISLEGKVALVTGASRGIGKAIATTMAASGAKVMLTSRKLDALQAAAAEIVALTPGADVEVFAANAGDVASAGECVAATIERFGGLDIIVNNAATNPYYGPTLGVDEARFDKTFGVNLRGPLFWCQAAWEQALKDKPGVIINIASVGGLRAESGLGVYNLTKAALIHMTRQLAGELGPTTCRGHRARPGADRLCGVPGRQLRRASGRAVAAAAFG